jgi:hypothetical protein
VFKKSRHFVLLHHTFERMIFALPQPVAKHANLGANAPGRPQHRGRYPIDGPVSAPGGIIVAALRRVHR